MKSTKVMCACNELSDSLQLLLTMLLLSSMYRTATTVHRISPSYHRHHRYRRHRWDFQETFGAPRLLKPRLRLNEKM